ncbi:SHD1 domain-containing protein [Pontiella sp.]|uniref:SHD1 domain-containing protein n=1 Tax=Pontiella sp. TaxID=2837462 RepID=UPI003562BD3E
MKHLLTGITLFSLMLSSAVHAQMRTWTDVRGNTIEAELVENMNGQVTLMLADGNETHISISNLSADDQKFVLVNSPPNISISVNEITSRSSEGFAFEHPENSDFDRDFQLKTSVNRYKVTLKRSGTIPYNKPIKAELYVIGYRKQTEEYFILSKTVKEFTFGEGENGDVFVFESNPVNTKVLQGVRDRGTVYHGNLVALVDDQGRVFDVKGTRSKMEEHAAFIRKAKPGLSMTKEQLASAINEAQ